MWNTSSSIPFTSALHCVNFENLSRAQELHQNKYFHQKLSTTTNVFTPNHYHYHQVIFGSKFRRQVGLQIYVHSESKRPNLRQNDFPNHPPRNPHPRVIGPAHTRAERAGTLEGDFQKNYFFLQKIFSQKIRINTSNRSFMPHDFNFSLVSGWQDGNANRLLRRGIARSEFVTAS